MVQLIEGPWQKDCALHLIYKGSSPSHGVWVMFGQESQENKANTLFFQLGEYMGREKWKPKEEENIPSFLYDMMQISLEMIFP